MASRHSIAVVLLALLAAHTVDAAARLVPSAAAAVAAELPAATPAPAAAAPAAAPAAPAIEVRHSVHPEALPSMGSKELRRHFLVDRLFAPGEVALTYTHEDRMIVGGATPLPGAPLALPSDRAIAKSIGRPTFLASRELAAINVGGPGRVVADGAAFDLAPLDALYVPMGTSAVKFESADKDRPAKFYLLSCPAHKQHAAAKISPRNATKVVTAGAGDTANNRTLYHLVVRA
jgi:4-deoxy-L-threo-5-hexosulose-uronate ketol-isomerase